MKRTWIKRESAKHRKARLIYDKKKKEWFAEHPGCQFEILPQLVCGLTYPRTLHHKMGRGKYLADERYFMTVCLNHHQWIEDHKTISRELGYILYR